jgi:ribosomal protein S14
MPRDGDPMSDAPGGFAPEFDGFPYLVTRIGRTPLRHIALLPAEWSFDRQAEAVRRQVRANRLDTCLCLGPASAVFVDAHGTEFAASPLCWGIPVIGSIALPEPLASTPELLARQAALEAFARRGRSSGYLVGDGLEGGRRATPEEVKRLSGRDEDGIPRGLRRCARCGEFRGDYLAVRGEGNGDRTPRVVPVHCHCENHNRCARCGEPLAGWRLSSYFFAEADRAVRYLAAYAALSHRCLP